MAEGVEKRAIKSYTVKEFKLIFSQNTLFFQNDMFSLMCNHFNQLIKYSHKCISCHLKCIQESRLNGGSHVEPPS